MKTRRSCEPLIARRTKAIDALMAIERFEFTAPRGTGKARLLIATIDSRMQQVPELAPELQRIIAGQLKNNRVFDCRTRRP